MAEQNLEELKRAPASAGLNDLIAKRWSPRAFADKPVAKGDLRKIFTAASWAASSYNEQPWRFILGIKGDEEHGVAYNSIFNSLIEMNQAWAKTAPVLIATVSKKTFSHNGSTNKVATHDVGAASANLCLQAIELGIHTHGMAGFDAETLRAYFTIPTDFDPVAVWAMGYIGDVAQLPEHFQKPELAPRQRRELDEFVFSEWGTGADF